jgi:uncharacterized tellurite resistance protein B-like protein
MSILKFLGLKESAVAAAPDSPETETVRRIVQQLDQLPPDRARYLASFAYLLSRAAGADLHITEEETRLMERIVASEGGLPPEQALLVVQMAKSQHKLFGGTENFLVTREFERLATRDQKLALLECLFAVTAADANITSLEDKVVKQISSELRLEHDDYIAARSRFKEHLAVLKLSRKPPQ